MRCSLGFPPIDEHGADSWIVYQHLHQHLLQYTSSKIICVWVCRGVSNNTHQFRLRASCVATVTKDLIYECAQKLIEKIKRRLLTLKSTCFLTSVRFSRKRSVSLDINSSWKECNSYDIIRKCTLVNTISPFLPCCCFFSLFLDINASVSYDIVRKCEHWLY